VSTYLPTLKQLQYLVALKLHGHFGRAAEACFVTQSTLSAGIKELENLIGVTLAIPKISPTWSAPPASRSRANCAWA
jgi:DNA-binding transcriptional LysR family regulator